MKFTQEQLEQAYQQMWDERKADMAAAQVDAAELSKLAGGFKTGVSYGGHEKELFYSPYKIKFGLVVEIPPYWSPGEPEATEWYQKQLAVARKGIFGDRHFTWTASSGMSYEVLHRQRGDDTW